MEIKGKPATIWMNLPSSLFLGETTFKLLEDKIIEKRKVFFEEREAILLLSHVEGIEILQKGDKLYAYIAFAFLIIKVFPLAIFFFLLYLLYRPYFLIIHGKNLQLIMTISKKNIEEYKNFAYEIIKKL
ncbi:MAG: hypothetical protein N2312_03010 [Dictyoglomaceae bacterium]|nr:hypothetical protein [Dictyoglomaceae bacterium]